MQVRLSSGRVSGWLVHRFVHPCCGGGRWVEGFLGGTLTARHLHWWRALPRSRGGGPGALLGPETSATDVVWLLSWWGWPVLDRAASSVRLSSYRGVVVFVF